VKKRVVLWHDAEYHVVGEADEGRLLKVVEPGSDREPFYLYPDQVKERSS
jgi:hypothetical protein